MWTAETCQFGDSGEANNLRLGSLMFAYVRLIGKKLLRALRAATEVRACLETTRGAVFVEKAGWRDEGEYPWWIFDRGATKPDGLFPENPPGGGSFVRGQRWLVPYSPLRGCSELAAFATAKIPRLSAPRSFQTGSKPHATESRRGLALLPALVVRIKQPAR